MNYLTKVYICFIGLIFFTTSITTGFIYYENRTFLFNELKSKVLSIAATTAALLDPTIIKEIKSPQDTESEAFQILKDELILASNINKRDDVYLLYAYLLRPADNTSEQVEFIIDSTSDPKASALPGQKYLGGDDLFYNLRNYYVPSDFIKNNWGKVLSAYAPVYDHNGSYVATLGVDVKSTDISDKLWSLLIMGIITFCIVAAFSLIIAFIFSKIISNNLQKIQRDVCKIGEGDLNLKIEINTDDEFNELAGSINHMTEGLKEREKIKENFAKYVSKQVLEKIIHGKNEIKLEGEKKKVTLLFSDVPKFTSLAERLEPENVVTLLNEFFSEMLDVIIEFDGTIDKFIGEGIMAEFGVPISDSNQELNAVRSAVKMHTTLALLLERWSKENKPFIDMCIGIHTGEAIVGNIGSDKRMEYTAIGDVVNTASRLTGLAKKKKLKILISEQVYENIKGEYIADPLGDVFLTGKTIKTAIYSIDPDQGK